MDQIAEKSAAEWIISEILNDASAVSVAVPDSQLFLGSIRKTLEQDCFDCFVPEAVDKRLVSEYRVRLTNLRTTEQNDQKKSQPHLAIGWLRIGYRSASFARP